jgi:site-specific recombinase XerC
VVRRLFSLGRNAKQNDSFTTEQLSAILNSGSNSHVDVRDRFLLLISVSALLRRSEVVKLQLSDIKLVPDSNGFSVQLRVQRSKKSSNNVQTVSLSPA